MSPRGDLLFVEMRSATHSGFHTVEVWKKRPAGKLGDPEEWERAWRWDKIKDDLLVQFAPDDEHLLLWTFPGNTIVVRNLGTGEIEHTFVGGTRKESQSRAVRIRSGSPPPGSSCEMASGFRFSDRTALCRSSTGAPERPCIPSRIRN